MEHPILSTSRLTIRPFLLSDASELFKLNASEQVMKYLPKDEVYEHEEQAEQFLKAYIDKSADLEFARQVVLRKSDGDWLGWCGLAKQENGEVDLGFRLHEKEWGRGYASESGRAWLEYGFNEGRLEQIVARAAKGNWGSHEAGLHWLRYELNQADF